MASMTFDEFEQRYREWASDLLSTVGVREDIYLVYPTGPTYGDRSEWSAHTWTVEEGNAEFILIKSTSGGPRWVPESEIWKETWREEKVPR